MAPLNATATIPMEMFLRLIIYYSSMHRSLTGRRYQIRSTNRINSKFKHQITNKFQYPITNN